MRLLVLGQGPLPLPGQENLRIGAPGLRTWHFALALYEAGHQVTIAVIDEQADDFPVGQEIKPNLTYYPTPTLNLPDFLTNLCASSKFDAAVGVSVFPAYLLALYLPPDLPLWADIFGSPMAEGQAKAFVHHDDTLIEPYARYERAVCRRADVFSTVSSYQEYALLGALATHGRFNQFSYGYNFVNVVPASISPEILPHSEVVMRGKLVPEPAFVILWSGGFNTWTDVDTLFEGLEGAIAQEPALHFVATGGSLPSHDELTYSHFYDLVAASPFQERFHLLGWLPLETLHNYYYEADLGIILDKWSYEGVLGSRTRLLDWLKYGLPAITTVTAELTRILVQENLSFSFPHSDSGALMGLILKFLQNRTQLKEAKARLSGWALENYTYTKVCQPLTDWANKPQLAPDTGHILDFGSNNSLETERKIADLTSQLEQKNAHIAQVENWAKDMEARLKANDKNNHLGKSLQGLGNVFKRK